jgi:HK97 gp10 family phage protein
MMLSVGERVKAAAAAMAPVQTGTLKSSIQYDLSETHGGDLMVIIGSNLRYAGFVEYGTSKMAAQPYLRPALDEVI